MVVVLYVALLVMMGKFRLFDLKSGIYIFIHLLILINIFDTRIAWIIDASFRVCMKANEFWTMFEYDYMTQEISA